MRVDVLYFGILKDATGVERETLELAEGADVLALLALVRRNFSQLSTSNTPDRGNPDRHSPDSRPSVWSSLAVAVNREYVSSGSALREGDEVALLPPVSGG